MPERMSGQAVHYTPLLRSGSSDDEDDDLDNDSDGNPSAKQHKAVQFRDLPAAKPCGSPHDSRVARGRRKNRHVIILAVVACVLVVTGVVAAGVFAFLSREFNSGLVHNVHFASHGDWTLFFNKSVTESGVTMVDVDGDGLDDILVGVTGMRNAERSHDLSRLTMREICRNLDLPYPCLSQVVALRGYDHKELWRTWMHYDLIFVNCDGIDVNGDEKPDCIFSGRFSALQAVDLATGHVHWMIEADNKTWSSHFMSMWLVCRALSIPDVDGDGIRDVLVTHGGDPLKEPEDHDRASGRVIFLSGRSGHPLGRYLAMPNDRETYMSPVRYDTANGSTYILLGSGGETVSGDLMIISFSDLCDYIMENKSLQLRTIYRGTEKGVMIPPVLTDITHDGTLDILMSAFEGVVALYDGETLQEIWIHQLSSPQIPDFESYSVPAPGRFDDDDVPDFMMMWGKGRYPNYEYATVYILSGANGKILWQRQSQMAYWYSAVTLRTTGPHDVFIMQTIAMAPATSDSPQLPTTHGTQHKRHIGPHRNTSADEPRHYSSPESFLQMCEESRQHYLEEHKDCSVDFSQWKTDVFVMDKTTSDSPVSIHSVFPYPYRYTLPVKEPGQHCHQLSPFNSSVVDICVVMGYTGFTGGVGDVDGDGEVDFIQAEAIVGTSITDDYRDGHMFGDMVLFRKSLDSALRGKAELVPMKGQPWRQFMGSSRDSVYRIPE